MKNSDKNQLKACDLSASIKHSYQHFSVSKKALIIIIKKDTTENVENISSRIDMQIQADSSRRARH